MPETVGAGGALLDYDGDGDLDVYLVQGGAFVPGNLGGGGGILFRNLLREDAALRFVEVKESGLNARGYGMGAATGDIDNDGRVDLFLANFSDDQLWRNQGDGTFTDVTARSGTSDPAWSVSASFVDYDRDGHLDLYVANYVDFRFEIHKVCRMASGAPNYCGPSSYAPVADRLYRNRGDGTFEDVTARSGIGTATGPGLGVLALDADDDGWLDLYVANDQLPNFLWRNRGNGTFEEIAMLAGCAVDADGKAHAGMGVDAADYDADGDLDLVISNLAGETHTLFRNEGRGIFRDATVESGLAEPSIEATGFGAAFLDADNDGALDLLVVNGAVRKLEAQVRAGDPYPLRQRNQLFRNVNGRFVDGSRDAGQAFDLAEVGRGALFGDLDDDGDIDVVVANNQGPARLLVNVSGSRRHWVGLEVVHGSPLRHALGATVTLERERRAPTVARVATDGSYASARDPRVLFGLGDDAPQSPRARVRWPDGAIEVFSSLAVGRYQRLERGKGVAVP
jgi:hypothetical protein